MRKKDITEMGRQSNFENTTFSFQKLTPTYDADIAVYEDALDFVFDENNHDIQNIALTGLYGSGKSSVINSYGQRRRKKFIHISLSHFDNASDEGRDDILEKKIVDQLVQQVPRQLIPDTKFKVKDKYRWFPTVANTILAVVFVLLTACILKYISLLTLNTENYYNYKEYFYTPSFAISICIIVFSVAVLVVQFVRWQRNKQTIHKIGYKDHEIELDNKDDKSFFNRHIDEILYVLVKSTCSSRKNTSFDGIIIEDIDRFDKNVDVKIFEKLRELCVLGNYRIIKDYGVHHQPLRFFYLLKDETFETKDRTKFFDYIIPILPVVDSSNAYAKLKTCLTEAGYYNSVDDHFLRGLSLYFDDFRLIKNIVNEFQIYARKISDIEHSYNELLSIIVYKNYFPKDFADLQLHCGYVYSLFKKRKELIGLEANQLNRELIELKDRLFTVNNEILSNELELQAVNAHRANNNNYKDKEYREWYREEYPKRLEAVKYKGENRIKEIRGKIAVIQTKITHVNSKKIFELITSDNEDYIFSINSQDGGRGDDKPKDNELAIQNDKYFDIIKYLIRSGYLNEVSYRDYLACFDENGMPLSDKNFVISVNNRVGKEFNYELKNTPVVYGFIDNSDFILPAVRNNNLIDYIIRNNKSEALELFIKQLKNNKDLVFVGQFIKYTSCFDSFIEEACKQWDGFISEIISEDNSIMSEIECQDVVLCALIVCDEEILKSQNDSQQLSKYLSERIRDVSCDNEDVASKISSNLLALDVKLININKQITSKFLRNRVINNNSYALNYENLKYILVNYLRCTQEEFDSRFLSSLTNSKNDNISKYMIDNLDKVVNLINDNFYSQEDLPEIVIFVASSDIDEELISEYLTISKTEIEDISKISDKYWHIIAKKHTFIQTSSNVVAYYKKYGFDDCFVCYLNNTNLGMESVFPDESEVYKLIWIDAYATNALCNDVYLAIVEEIGEPISNFNTIDLEINKCQILINHKLIEMNEISIKTFRNHYSELLKEFICENIEEYIGLVNGQLYIIDEVKSLLEESQITDEQKIQLLSMSEDPISVVDMHLSDRIFREVLANHFDINNLNYLLTHYDSYNDHNKEIVYDTVITSIGSLPSVLNGCSKELLSKIFEDSRIELTYKINILDALLQSGKKRGYIATLLRLAGEDMLSRLFGQERSRMSPVLNDPGHAQLLEVLKKHGLINDYFESEDGKHLRIKR